MQVIKRNSLKDDPNKKNLLDGVSETQKELKHPLIRIREIERQGSRERSRLTKRSGAIHGIGEDVHDLLNVGNHRRALWTPVP